MAARGHTYLIRAAAVVAVTVGAGALFACSERPTGPPSAPPFAAGIALDRAEHDRSSGATTTLAWEQITRELVANRKLTPINAVRLLALHSIADYAALVAVNHGDDAADGEADGNGVAGYEARRGAIGGASAQLLSVSPRTTQPRSRHNSWRLDRTRRVARTLSTRAA